MVDEIYDRHHQAGRAQLNAELGRVFARAAHAIHNAFTVLNRIEYDAPWAARPRRAR